MKNEKKENEFKKKNPHEHMINLRQQSCCVTS